jgi:hypothetical protein
LAATETEITEIDAEENRGLIEYNPRFEFQKDDMNHIDNAEKYKKMRENEKRIKPLVQLAKFRSKKGNKAAYKL